MVTFAARAGALAVLLLVPVAAAQQPAGDRTSPPARGHHAVYWDAERQRVMVTGGAANDERRRVTVFDDLWSFDGERWSALPPTGEASWGTRIASDARQRPVAFGGVLDSTVGDARALENGRWRLIGRHPSVVASEAGFVFDEARDRFVLFGGGVGSRRLVGDVWEFDGARWTRHAATPPPPRFAHAMVYDARRRRIVVFGGMGTRAGDDPAPVLADTWEFDGTSWTQRRVAGPSPRLGAGIAFDSKRGLVILFGGSSHEGVLGDLWSWDGESWRKLAEGGPAPRVMGYIAYDAARDRIVLFGGRSGSPGSSDLGDTWEWNGERWRRVGP